MGKSHARPCGHAGEGARVTGRRWLISGRVQGVGFRWFVLQHARRLRLSGYARNLPDGRVEVAVRGREDRVADLSRLVQQGPSGAVVQAIEEADYPHEVDSYNSFKIC